jgi:hypothetical protein
VKAHSLIRAEPWYRREAFAAGLKAAGLEVEHRPPVKPDRNTVLVIWNRYGSMHELALQTERAGGTVWVAENGYLGAGGSSPKFDVHPGGPQPHHYYALAEGWHNGRGRWPVVAEDAALAPTRFQRLGVELKPWRTEGDYVLVCPNRSFGIGEQVMHPDWAERTAARLRKQTKLEVRVRAHPGNNAPKRTLAEDLSRAAICVVWSSGAAVHALAEGIPTYIEAPFQILKGAAAAGPLHNPGCPERAPHFERMAWAQWSVAEIQSGEPFRHLLRAARESTLARGA